MSHVHWLKMSSVEDGGRPRKSSQSSRFEIEKVTSGADESIPMTSAEATSAGANDPAADPLHDAHKSALKKSVKHWDDPDFGPSSQSTPLKSKQYDTQTSSDSEQGGKRGGESEDEQTGCFQVVYNERNQPQSIVVNLTSNKAGSSSGAGSGSRCKDCVYDLKTVALYQKLIAEFLGTLLLTLYACSIGLPIAEENGVPSINGNQKLILLKKRVHSLRNCIIFMRFYFLCVSASGSA